MATARSAHVVPRPSSRLTHARPPIGPLTARSESHGQTPDPPRAAGVRSGPMRRSTLRDTTSARFRRRGRRGDDPAARAVLFTAALAHILHDGFSDVLYVLLPLWASGVQPDADGRRSPQGRLHRRHGALARSPPASSPSAGASGGSWWSGTAVTAPRLSRRRDARDQDAPARRCSSSWRGSAPASSTPWPPHSSRERTRPVRGGRRWEPTTSRATWGRSPCRPPWPSRRARSAGASRAASTPSSGLGGHRLHRPRAGPDRGGHRRRSHGGAEARAAEAGASETRAASRRCRRSA